MEERLGSETCQLSLTHRGCWRLRINSISENQVCAANVCPHYWPRWDVPRTVKLLSTPIPCWQELLSDLKHNSFVIWLNSLFLAQMSLICITSITSAMKTRPRATEDTAQRRPVRDWIVSCLSFSSLIHRSTNANCVTRDEYMLCGVMWKGV